MALFIVPTPIGNLADITLRALEILKKVDFIVCEDTRQSKKLLNHYNISRPLISYYQPREKIQAEKIVPLLKDKDGALITDSGTPAISDPGYILIKTAIAGGIEIVPLPGPTAFVPALVASGLPPSGFIFYGFPPRKPGKLKRLLEKAVHLQQTIIFYENVQRALRLLQTAATIMPEGRFCLCRELTKINETFIRGKLSEVEKLLSTEKLKGECVLLLNPDE